MNMRQNSSKSILIVIIFIVILFESYVHFFMKPKITVEGPEIQEYVDIVIELNDGPFYLGNDIDVKFWIRNKQNNVRVEFPHYSTIDVNWYHESETPQRAPDIFLSLVPDAKIVLKPNEKHYLTEITLKPTRIGTYIVEIFLSGNNLELDENISLEVE